MPIHKKTGYGQIKISDSAIASLVGTAVSECYGVVGVTSKSVRDSFNGLLRKENYGKGVSVSLKNNALIIDLYLLISYGVKISEVVFEAQKRVRYSIESTLNMDVKEINIHVEGIR